MGAEPLPLRMADAPFEPGTLVDRYTVEAVLGRGGMAVVYRVRHNQLGTLHALKVLSLAAASVRDRLLQEGKVQAVLRHPNIVAVTDVIEVNGTPGLVMEYVRGPSLEALLSHKRLTLDQVDEIAAGLLTGVAAAHAKGLIHRDLKPANVMLALSEAGILTKVADFGLAKILDAPEGGLHRTRSGVTMGTPAYMAPEQIRDAKNVDVRADVYSLGVMLYELVTGVRPHDGADILEIFTSVAGGTYVPPQERVPDLPERMARAIEAALVVDRDKRIGTVEALHSLWNGESTGDWQLREASAPFSPEMLAEMNDLGGGGDESIVRHTYETKLAAPIGRPSKATGRSAPPPASASGAGATTPFITVDLHTETGDPPPSSFRTIAIVAALVGIALVLGVGATGAAGVALFAWPRAPATTPAAPVMPVVVEAPPEPVASPPIAVVPDAPALPVPAPVRPRDVPPDAPPAAVIEAPIATIAAVQPPAAPSSVATFTVKGDVSRVYLKSTSTGVSLPAGEVPPGSYTIEVFFDDTPLSLRRVDLIEGQVLSVACNQAFRVCK